MAVTGLTCGQVVAWNEPRVQATGLILLAALVLFVVARLVANDEFTVLVSVLMGIVPWIVVKQAGVIRHPVDPIGGSESAAIQTYYGLILLTVVGLALTLIAAGQTQLLINTATVTGRYTDEGQIRAAAIRHKIPLITTMTGAQAAVEAIRALRSGALTVTALHDFFNSPIEGEQR